MYAFFSPVARKKGKESRAGICELKLCRKYVLVWLLSCQHLSVVLRSIFYRKTTQDPNSQHGYAGSSTVGMNESQRFWSLSQSSNTESSGGLNGSIYGDQGDTQSRRWTWCQERYLAKFERGSFIRKRKRQGKG